MKQRIIEINGSPVIIIPDEFLRLTGLKTGDEINVMLDEKRRIITIKPILDEHGRNS